MKANKTLLQMKISRVIALFASKVGISLDDALQFFYNSKTSYLIHEGIADFHCMSDIYLADELKIEYQKSAKELPLPNGANAGAKSATSEISKCQNGTLG